MPQSEGRGNSWTCRAFLYAVIIFLASIGGLEVWAQSGITPLSISLSEATPTGQCIVNFTEPSGALLPAGTACSVTPVSTFTIGNAVSKSINVPCLQLLTRLDVDHQGTQNYITPLVQCRRPGEALSSSLLWSISITIQPANDEHPLISVGKHNFLVSEKIKVGTKVTSLTISDADKPSDVLTVQLKPSTFHPGTFSISRGAGDTYNLKIAKPLDFETTPLYSLTISATDTAGHSASAVINVTVVDENDEPPQFTQRMYTAPVSENASLHSPVIRLQALDKDSKAVTNLRYSLLYNGSTGQKLLSVSPQSGSVTTSTAPLPVGVHHYIAIVSDGIHKDEVPLKLNVTDINDQPPVITRSCLGVEEFQEPGPPPGTVICMFTIDDADHGDNGRVNVQLYGGQGAFSLTTSKTVRQTTPLSVSVMLTTALDFETKSTYHLILKASDNGQPAQRAELQVTVRVSDSNEHAPKFEHKLYQVAIPENSMANDLVETVEAVDPDGSSSPVSYHIIKVSDLRATGWFRIDTRAPVGLLKVNRGASLDRELLPSVTLVVEATDTGTRNGQQVTLKSTANVTVTLLDVNDNAPVFSKPSYTGDITENSVDGTSVLQLTAADRDEGANGTVTYSLSASNGGSAFPFTIDKHGVIKVVAGGQANIDREKKASYNLTATASDLGNPPKRTSALVHINLIDANDNPPVFYPQTDYCNIEESSSPGRVCTIVIARDNDTDAFGRVTYSIVSGNIGDAFLLNNASGLLTTRHSLDREQIPSYTLVIQAQDGGGMVAVPNAIVHISVLNIDDKPPVFNMSGYAFNVTEDASINTTIGHVVAERQDAKPNPPQLIYSITGGDPTGYFSVAHLKGNIRVAKKLDREAVSFFNLIITVEEPGSPSLYASALVNITLLDVNDNPPSFGKSSDSARVPECASVGHVVYQANATDTDVGKSARVRYAIVYSSVGGFEIDRTTGVLTLAKNMLDAERAHKEFVVIKAADRGLQRLTSTMNLTITVQDCNDNAPQFTSSSYFGSVSEGTAPSTSVLAVKATDLDSFANGTITYTLMNANRLPFDIYPSSGTVYVSNKLDREQRDTYNLTVLAADGDHPPLVSSVHVYINITDANDLSPVFDVRVYNFSVQEYDPLTQTPAIPTQLGSVHATDGDLGMNSKVQYSLATNSSLFKIDPITGLLSAISTLDREGVQGTQRTLRVIATDQGSPAQLSGSCTVRISITDINDNPPLFVRPPQGTSAIANVFENATIGSLVYTVQAQDHDAGGNSQVTYSWAKSETSGKFKLNITTGAIQVYSPLDFEDKDFYELVIKADDHGRPVLSSTATIRVFVMDVNDISPRFLNSSDVNVSVLESLKVNSPIARVVATDKETASNGNGKIRYSISSGNSQGTFTISVFDGTVYLAKSFNYSLVSNYSLIITAEDSPTAGKPLSAKLTLHVAILPYTDTGPYFPLPHITVSVLENATAGHLITKLHAEDRDMGKNGILHYALISETAVGGKTSAVPHFAVNSITGQLTVKSSLDYETASLYTLLVMATDQSPSQWNATATVIVQVININEFQPIVPQPQHLILPENEVTGRVIYTAVARDQDSGIYGRIKYEFLWKNNTLSSTDGLFTINTMSGEIFLAHSLDYETKSSYKLVIRCADSAGDADGLYSDLHLNITIVDVNDNAPRFTSSGYFATVQENLPAGTSVVTVNATDADSGRGGQVVYVLANGGDGAFTVNSRTGVIRTTRPLDRENISNYSLTIVAKDRGNPVLLSKTSVIVNVGDDNDFKPGFFKSVYIVEVAENTQVGSVATLLAVDHDMGSNRKVRYSIIGGNIHNVFRITPKAGLLVVKEPLDRENISRYYLTVQVCDSPVNPLQRLCSNASVNVTVGDDNDNYPIFHPATYSAQVAEDAQTGHSILQVTATDKDTGNFGKVHYQMNDPSGKFAIDSKTGVVSVIGHLDHEDRVAYLLPVRAIDSDPHGPRSSTATITIAVTDVNEFAPAFTQSMYTVNVSERILVGGRVFNMTAIDIDSGRNALVTYNFSDASTNFAINPSTGMVTTRQKLSSQPTPFVVSVLAKDSGSPSLNASARLHVNVLPFVQTPPRFLQDVKIIYRQNDITANSIIDKLEAITDDPAIKLYYELLSVSPTAATSSFTVSTLTGDVSTRSTVSFARNAVYKLDVRALNSRDSSNTARMTLQIQRSVLQHVYLDFLLPLSASFPESIAVNTSVLTVNARSDFKQTIPRYSIIAGNENNTFRIVSSNGTIFTNRELDYETKSFYSLSVLATDMLNISRPTIGTVSFRLTDINDHKPFWTSLPRNPVEVSENAQVTSAVAQVQAEDLDSDGFSYRLENNVGFYFGISPGGEITLARPLDYERQRNYSLVVVAEDSEYSVKTTVNIRVVDENDNSPVFALPTQTTWYVNEKSPRGVTVAWVTARDLDSGTNGQVRYKLGNYNNTFAINPLTGNITLLRSLTYNSSDNLYQLNVIAYDTGKPPMQSSESVFVEVKDINDHSPVFSKHVYSFTVQEDAVIQSVVGKVSADDEDIGLNALVTYGIVKGSGMFFMNQNDGTILLLRSLDRELVDRYQLNVSAKDGGQPERAGYAIVNVFVSDVNDNAPQFDKSEYTVRVQEGFAATNVLLEKVHATDADSGNNSDIVYSISQGNEKSGFRINMYTGEIFSLIPLAYTGARHLVVTARDSAPPYHHATVRVNIVVFKPNQCVPMFTRPIYRTTIAENTALNHLVLQVTAVLPKNNTNAIVYSFANNTSRQVENTFSLNSTGGQLRVKTQPDYERVKEYNFSVQATDRSCPNQVGSAQVNVFISNINENRPVFRHGHYSFKVQQDTPVNTEVGTVSAIDNDSHSYLKYYFGKINKATLAGLFSITEDSGQILLIKDLQKQQDTHVINGTVIAWDGQWNASAQITITIKQTTTTGAVSNSGSSSMLVIIAVIVVVCFALFIIIGLVILMRRRSKADKHQISSGYAYADANNRPESSRGLLNHSLSMSSAPSTSQRMDSTSSEVPLMARQNVDKLSALKDDPRAALRFPNGNANFDSPATGTTAVKLSSMTSFSTGSDRSFQYRGPFPSMEHEQIHEFGEEGAGEAFGGMGGGGIMDVNTVLYHKLAEIEADEYDAVMDGTRCFTAEGALSADNHAPSLGSVFKLADEFVAQGRQSWLDDDFKGMDDAFLELSHPPSSEAGLSSARSLSSSKAVSSAPSARILSVEVDDNGSISSADDVSHPDDTPILHTPTPSWAKSPSSSKSPATSSTHKQSHGGGVGDDVTKKQRQDALDELIGNFDTDNDSASDNDVNIRILSDYEPEEV